MCVYIYTHIHTHRYSNLCPSLAAVIAQPMLCHRSCRPRSALRKLGSPVSGPPSVPHHHHAHATAYACAHTRTHARTHDSRTMSLLSACARLVSSHPIASENNAARDCRAALQPAMLYTTWASTKQPRIDAPTHRGQSVRYADMARYAQDGTEHAKPKQPFKLVMVPSAAVQQSTTAKTIDQNMAEFAAIPVGSVLYTVYACGAGNGRATAPPARRSAPRRCFAHARSLIGRQAERRIIGSISSIDGCGATQAQRSSTRQPRARSRSSSATTSRPRSALPASVYTATPGGSISGVLRARLGWVKYS